MGTSVPSLSVLCGDVREWAACYDGRPFTALLCDPPYHLTSITARYGAPGAAPAQYAKDGAFSRLARGFMGKTWDGGDVAFDPKTWASLGEHLVPGAILMAFGGTRTWHRLAVAIEDGGFEVFDTLMWLYGSGMPKNHDMALYIDKAAGIDRVREITGPATPDARTWTGYGTALKPAWEPIIVARKPREGSIVNTAMRYGSGGLNIDGSRIGADEQGRWPANLLLSHSPDCTEDACTADCPIADLGHEARFFYHAKASKEERDVGLEAFPPVAAGGMSGRHDGSLGAISYAHNDHPTVKPIALCQYLAGLLLPPETYRLQAQLLVPFAGSGSEMIGAMLAGWENITGIEADEDYASYAEYRLRWWQHAMQETVSRAPTEILRAMRAKARNLKLPGMDAA